MQHILVVVNASFDGNKKNHFLDIMVKFMKKFSIPVKRAWFTRISIMHN